MKDAKALTYQELIERFPLRPIKSDRKLDAAHVVAKELFLRANSLSADESDYLDVLSTLIHKYESQFHELPNDQIASCEILRYLLKTNEMKQADLIGILGISSGRASELVNGKRELSKSQIVVLSEYFGVSANLFLGGSAA